MKSESEERPHVVYARANPKDAEIFATYELAHRYWNVMNNWNYPYEIVTLGRRCTPAAEIVDVSE